MSKKQERKCSICGSLNRVSYSSQHGDYLCNIHRMQLYHSGAVKLESRNSPSRITICESYGKIDLLDKHGDVVGIALIDLNDIPKCANYKWHIQNNGYVSATVEGKRQLLHRFILDAPQHTIVDHINHNTLDNRRTNLRFVTCSQNNMNRKLQSYNSSGVSGVSIDKRDGKYDAYITCDGKRRYLGHFPTLDEASMARRDAEIKEFGEYRYRRCLNCE